LRNEAIVSVGARFMWNHLDDFVNWINDSLQQSDSKEVSVHESDNYIVIFE